LAKGSISPNGALGRGGNLGRCVVPIAARTVEEPAPSLVGHHTNGTVVLALSTGKAAQRVGRLNDRREATKGGGSAVRLVADQQRRANSTADLLVLRHHKGAVRELGPKGSCHGLVVEHRAGKKHALPDPTSPHHLGTIVLGQ